MAEPRKKFTPEQVLILTLVVSVIAHAVFLSFDWYKKHKQATPPALSVVIKQATQDQPVTEPEVAERIVEEDLVVTSPTNVVASEVTEVPQQPIAKTLPDKAQTQLNYGHIRISLDDILAVGDKSLKNGQTEVCLNKAKCGYQAEQHVQLAEDRFGFQSGLADNAPRDYRLTDELVAYETLRENYSATLTAADTVDQFMYANAVASVNERRLQQRHLDCDDPEEATACSGQVDLLHILGMGVRLVEKVIKDE